MSFFYLLTLGVCGGYLALLMAYIIGWKKTAEYVQAKGAACKTKVTVILPVRDEEKNIQTILGHLSKQDYSRDQYEICVVDDMSADRTAALTEAAGIANLKLIRLTSAGGKKQAIAEGVKHSTGELIITTDADCEMGKGWISTIVSYYETYKPVMIVGPVLLKDERSFSDIAQSQEMSVLTALACGSLYYNRPLLCSGANLAYEKKAFHAVNGFEGIDKTPTGDDVFLMLKFNRHFKNGIKYMKSAKAAVHTTPELTPLSAIKQRKRWASKTFSYGQSYVTGVAILIFLMNFLMLLTGILSVINVKFAYALIITLPLKCAVDIMFLLSASRFFGKKVHYASFFIASLLYPVYVSVIGLVSPFTNFSWKGRES